MHVLCRCPLSSLAPPIGISQPLSFKLQLTESTQAPEKNACCSCHGVCPQTGTPRASVYRCSRSNHDSRLSGHLAISAPLAVPPSSQRSCKRSQTVSLQRTDTKQGRHPDSWAQVQVMLSHQLPGPFLQPARHLLPSRHRLAHQRQANP